MFKWSLQKPDC